LQEAGHLEGGEVLAVLPDPVVGAAIEEEETIAVLDEDVPEVARVVDAVTVLRLVGLGVVEVPLEEARVRGDAADLAHRLGVVDDLAVGAEPDGWAFLPTLVQNFHVRVGDLADAAARVALLAEGGDR